MTEFMSFHKVHLYPKKTKYLSHLHLSTKKENENMSNIEESLAINHSAQRSNGSLAHKHTKVRQDIE